MHFVGAPEAARIHFSVLIEITFDVLLHPRKIKSESKTKMATTKKIKNKYELQEANVSVILERNDLLLDH